MINEKIKTIIGDKITDINITNPEVTFTQHDTIKAITTPIQKPFAVISKDGTVTSFDKDLCAQGAKLFLEGSESPINITCFIVDAILKRINQLIIPMNEDQIKNLLSNFNIRTEE